MSGRYLVNVMTAICLAASCLSVHAAAKNSRPTGTFIQLNREAAKKSVEGWSRDVLQMKAMGIRTLIIQWSATADIAYFESSELPQKEQYPAVENILKACIGEPIDVYLGLQMDEHYWSRIRARNQVLRDYFLARVAENEIVQKALLNKFARSSNWKGYYIPDEIDDLNWRRPDRLALIKGYIQTLTSRIQANDRKRKISVSAFFRSRTAPKIVAATLREIAVDSGLDSVIVQDGVGVGDPPLKYLSLYYDALLAAWKTVDTDLWAVVEVFEQTSGEDAPFTAIPANPERVKKQIADAAGKFAKTILFAFPDYVDPDNGSAHEALYLSLKN